MTGRRPKKTGKRGFPVNLSIMKDFNVINAGLAIYVRRLHIMWWFSLSPFVFTGALVYSFLPNFYPIPIAVAVLASAVFFLYAPKSVCVVFRQYLRDEPGVKAVLKVRSLDDQELPQLFLEEFFPDTLKISWLGRVEYETRTEAKGYDLTMRNIC